MSDTPPKMKIRGGVPLPKWARKYIEDYEGGFPKNFGECLEKGNRPCPFVRCKYHLLLDVASNRNRGELILNFPGIEPYEMAATCALKVALDGDHPLEDVADYMNITKEGARQIEIRALEVFRDDEKICEFSMADTLSEILEDDWYE